MPVTYTNRKGVNYTLCQGISKTGKPRYHFARVPKGRQVVEGIPEGWRISESVNGIVSLVRERPRKVLPEETAAVEAAVQRHPKARRYRVSVKHRRVDIYESVGPDLNGMVSDLKEIGLLTGRREDKLRALLEDRARPALHSGG
jgi:hypothetical protein